MYLTIQKWGRSAAIRLSAELLDQLGLAIGDSVELSVSPAGRLMIEASKPKYKLTDLLSQMPNHMPMVEGWDAMQETGQENIKS